MSHFYESSEWYESLAMTHSVTYNAGGWLNTRWNQSLLVRIARYLWLMCELSALQAGVSSIALRVLHSIGSINSWPGVIDPSHEKFKLTSSHSASMHASIISCHASPVATRNSNIDAEAIFLKSSFDSLSNQRAPFPNDSDQNRDEKLVKTG